MRGTVRLGSAVLLVALAALAALPAHAQQSVTATETAVPGQSAPPIPFAGISADISRVTGELDEATARALELETEIEALEAERAALEERLEVTAERIRTQREELRAAEERLEEARERYQARLVEVYKRGAINPITLLFSSDTLTELVSRAGILTRIAEDDSRVVSDLTVATADARYQATALEELLAQDKQLQAEQRQRIASLEKALDEQEALVAKLTVEAREALLTARRFTAETRAQWRAASIPIGTSIPRATAKVEPYAELTYAISAYMPRTYRTTGRSWTAVASWYGPGFNGRGTASGQVFNEDDYTCASRTLPFGTVLALTRGGRRVIVYVNDRGPFIAGRDLDLSKAAAQALGFGGVATLHAEIVVPVTE